MSDLERAARAEARRRFPYDDDQAYYQADGFRQCASWLAEYLLSDENVEKAARTRWPYLWDADAFEHKLAGLSIFTPEQAAESAEKKRQEKLALVRDVLSAVLGEDTKQNNEGGEK